MTPYFLFLLSAHTHGISLQMPSHRGHANQILHLSEKGPIFTRLHAFHEQVRDPICRIHIMSTTTIIPRVFS